MLRAEKAPLWLCIEKQAVPLPVQSLTWNLSDGDRSNRSSKTAASPRLMSVFTAAYWHPAVLLPPPSEWQTPTAARSILKTSEKQTHKCPLADKNLNNRDVLMMEYYLAIKKE